MWFFSGKKTRATVIWGTRPKGLDHTTELDKHALLHKLQHELLCNYSTPCVDGDFHAADLLVDVLHELDDEIDQLVLPQLLQVCVSHEKTDVVSLGKQRAWEKGKRTENMVDT